MGSGTPRNYGLLDQPQEDALHISRLLQVEERPFQRVTRALLSKDSGLRALPKQLPSPPPEGGDVQDSNAESASRKRENLEEEIVLDLAALDNSIIRIQLIQSSNAHERERYASEKAKILETAQAVKDNIISLRMQLETAQTIMAQRKGYDELAAKILDDKKIKSRDESRTETEKLEKENDDLEQESSEYDNTWNSRKEQFERVVAEGHALVRLIKGIKDEPGNDKKETDEMEDAEDDKDDGSLAGTPLPGGRTPMPLIGNETPITGSGGITTESGASPLKPVNRLLDVEGSARLNSGASSPRPSNVAIDMVESSADGYGHDGTGGSLENMDES